MSSVTPQAVAALRARTGVSILACKQALEEAQGNEEMAIEILRKRGIAQAVKKSDRAQGEGAIFVAEGSGKAALVVVRCETDFVGRSDGFVAMGNALATVLATKDAAAFKTEADTLVPEAVQKLGENISVGETMEVDAPVIGTYVHSNRKIAVIIGLDKGDATKAKDVAMHAAAMNPQYVRPEEVPSDVVEKERGIWKEQMSKEKKPAEIMEKIMLGKEKKFREENALLKQSFVKDSAQSVEQYLSGSSITAYHRIAI
jgi:elongation factor Ts